MDHTTQSLCSWPLCRAPLPVAHVPSPHWAFLQGIQSLLSALFKALKLPPPASGWDSVNPVDINYLLDLMEEVICPEGTAGQGFWEEAKGREDPFTFTRGSVKPKGRSFPLLGQR